MLEGVLITKSGSLSLNSAMSSHRRCEGVLGTEAGEICWKGVVAKLLSELWSLMDSLGGIDEDADSTCRRIS